jgi:hypothetical protein
METLAIGLFLAAVNTKVIDYLAEPVRRRYPKLDMWWLLYVAAVTGFAISWLAGVNLFGDFIADPVLGRVLSGVLVGGGSSLIHDVFDRPELEKVELADFEY